MGIPAGLAVLSLAAACGTSPDPAPSTGRAAGPGQTEPATGVEVRRALEPGTTVEIASVRVVVADPEATGARGRSATLLTGLLREALRQSDRIDFAAGVETAGGAAHTLEVTADLGARALSASLAATEGGRVPLVSLTFEAETTTDAIDRLARSIRAALGDRGGAATTAPVAAIYSASARCVELTEQAQEALVAGRTQRARTLLERARRADAGCTVTLAGIATTMTDAGQTQDAIRLTNDTLRHLKGRLSPTTRIRLARTLLLARAALARSRRDVQDYDRQLLDLGAVSVRERPFDPHAAYTRALALNYLRRFDESAPILRALHERWPEVGGVAYHLAFALLASDAAAEALQVLERSASAIPAARRLLPTALALFHTGQLAELAKRLDREIDSVGNATAPQQTHELHRMRASLAILMGDRETARQHLVADLDWLRHHPTLLAATHLEVAEAGEVLAQLGFHAELATAIEATQPLVGRSTGLSQALTYLAGLVLVQSSAGAPTTALATLDQERSTVWATLLRAAAHRVRGEIVDETRELATAARISDAALIRANLSRALRALGRDSDADDLLAALRRELVSIDLRRPLEHPLLGPARALAFAATGRGTEIPK